MKADMKSDRLFRKAAAVLTATGLLLPLLARAHRDTLDGPVVTAARTALEQKDVIPVLKWVNRESEPEIRRAFARTQAVRMHGPEARALADEYFFETVVRLHRAGEGEPFTGLKPAGVEVDPAVAKADDALRSGSVDGVIKLASEAATAGIRQRFARVRELQAHADDSVEAGREYVAAYINYVHYVEELHRRASASGHAEPQPQHPPHESKQ